MVKLPITGAISAKYGVPFLFISHIVRGRIDMTNCKWVTPEYFAALSPSRSPQRDDVLYTAVGSYGIPCLVDTDEPFCFQRHIAIARPNQNLLSSEYLVWSLRSSDVFEQATKSVTGSAQLTIPLSAIRKLRFPLPSLEEQKRIVACLEGMRIKADALGQLHNETAAERDALLPSALNRAFRGKL